MDLISISLHSMDCIRVRVNFIIENLDPHMYHLPNGVIQRDCM